MSGELDAAGALATAGLVAGAIEGRGGAEAAHGPCLNCGAELTGRYCASCGQAAHAHRTLAHVFEEFLHGVLHFDTKAWRTLPMMIGRPGTLTRNYIYGKRARYISPLALFLFCVFFMFFVFSFTSSPPPGVEANFNSDRLAQSREDLADARAGLAEARADAAGSDGLADALTARAVALAEAEVARREAEVTRIESEERAAREAIAAGETPEPAQTHETAHDNGVHADTGSAWLDRTIEHAAENPELSLYKIQQAAYKWSFLLVPISLPFIALLFLWKRGLTLYDHVVFALYSLSFASLVFVGVMLSAYTPWTAWITLPLLFIALPVHTFFHLGGAYGLGWFSALWRTFFMLIFATIALVIFAAVISLLGVAH